VQVLDGQYLSLPLANLHRTPGFTPERETNLAPGELITAIKVPMADHARSAYVKVRDRASYAFALVSAAVSLTLDNNGPVTHCAIALGGFATKPWCATTAEAMMIGQTVTRITSVAASRAALVEATPTHDQEFKVDLACRVIAKAIMEASGQAQAPAHVGLKI